MATLYDSLTRHQVYFEGVKAWFSGDFGDTLTVLNRRVTNIILSSPQRNFGDLTAAEYRNLERRMSRQLDTLVKRSKEVLLSDLKKVSAVDNKVLQDILLSQKGTRRRMPNNATLWRQVETKVLGATGETMGDMLDKYYANIKQTMLRELRKARTDAKSVDEVLDTFKGTKAAAFKDGLLNKFKNQANTVLATTLQHITSVSQNYLERIFYERYRWVAVLDEVTTNICRGRDGKTWAYGKGPLPPAHYNCRSKIVPEDGDRTNRPASFFEWLRSQPFIVLSDIVGSVAALRIKNGLAKAVEFPKFMSTKKLPIDQFQDKVPFILAD